MARNTPVNDNGEHDCDYIGTPCRHLTCGRCNKVTDNTTQGHYWGWCTATNSLREMHFCCPDDCELTEVRSYAEAVNAPLSEQTIKALNLELASGDYARFKKGGTK